jgi:hypothetical protein
MTKQSAPDSVGVREKGRLAGILLAAVAVLLALAYLGLCASVSPDTVLPGTHIVYPGPAEQGEQMGPGHRPHTGGPAWLQEPSGGR